MVPILKAIAHTRSTGDAKVNALGAGRKTRAGSFLPKQSRVGLRGTDGLGGSKDVRTISWCSLIAGKTWVAMSDAGSKSRIGVGC